MEKGWQAIEIGVPNGHQFTMMKPAPKSTEVHVMPLDDLVIHSLVGLECACGVVRQQPSGIYVHNAWDGREDDE